MILLVCGGRSYPSNLVVDWLDTNLTEPVSCLIHGGQIGADAGAALWAANHNIYTVCFPPRWKLHGKAAGPIRNAQMLREGKPDLVIAFPGGKGTANMVGLVKAVGIRLIEVTDKPSVVRPYQLPLGL